MRRHLSLSAMKMTLLSSRMEAKTCSSLPTLRHCSRLSKSTCSSRESTGRHSVSSYWTRGQAAESVESECVCTARLVHTGVSGFCCDVLAVAVLVLLLLLIVLLLLLGLSENHLRLTVYSVKLLLRWQTCKAVAFHNFEN